MLSLLRCLILSASFALLAACGNPSAPVHPLVGTWETAISSDGGSLSFPGGIFSLPPLSQTTQVLFEFKPGGSGSVIIHTHGAVYDTMTFVSEIRWRTEGGNPPRRLLFDKITGQLRGREDWNIEMLNDTVLIIFDRDENTRMFLRRTGG